MNPVIASLHYVGIAYIYNGPDSQRVGAHYAAVAQIRYATSTQHREASTEFTKPVLPKLRWVS